MSFDKAYNEDVNFGQYDIAMYDDPEYMYSPSVDNPVAYWDYYDYKDFSSRIIDMEWTREVDFPYSVTSAMADFSVNNFDDLFSPNSGSPIDQYILPKRPLRLLAGYTGVGSIQQFVGITEATPTLEESSKTASFHATDFLTEIFATELRGIIAMQNVTTDEVIEAIFTQFGISPLSYSLKKGRNKIPFVFFNKDKNAGEAIRELMQAEGGNLWIDEQGIIRFEPRLNEPSSPVMVFDESNIIDIEGTGESEIINWVKIKSDVRKVQPFQSVVSNTREPDQEFQPSDNGFVIQANSSRPYSADLPDPCLTVEQPTIGEKASGSWITFVTLAGVPVGSNVSITGSSLTNNQFVVFIQNNNSFPIQVDESDIWGEPALIVDTIRYEAKDQDSIDEYEPQVLDIQNDFFQNYSNCDSFAETIVDAYKDYSPVISIDCKGDLSLQLGDIIDVDARLYDNQYKIIAITNVVGDYKCNIKARLYNPRVWAQYDVSLYDVGIYAP